MVNKITKNLELANLFLLIALPVIIIVLIASIFITDLFFYAVLICAFLAMGLLLAFKYEYLALVFLIFWIAFEPVLLKFLPENLFVLSKYGPELLIYLILLINFFRQMYKTKSFSFSQSAINRLFILFVFSCVISILINLDSLYIGILGIRQIIRFVLVYFLIIYSNLTRPQIKRLFYALLFLMVIEISIALLQTATYGSFDSYLLPDKEVQLSEGIILDSVDQFWQAGQRVFATFGRYDRLGGFLVLACLGVVAFLYEKKCSVIRLIALMSILGAGLITLLLTYSRASWLAVLAGCILIGAIIKKDLRFIVATAMIVLAFGGYLVYYLVATRTDISIVTDLPQASLMERFLQTFSKQEMLNSYEGLGRIYFWVNVPSVVVANYPLFGVGPGYFGGGVAAALGNKVKYNELGLPFGVYGEIGQIDNNWFSLWAETGTIGLALFIGIFVKLYQTAKNIYLHTKDQWLKALSLGLRAQIIGVCVLAFFGPYFELRTLMFYFWLLAGLTILWSKKEVTGQ